MSQSERSFSWGELADTRRRAPDRPARRPAIRLMEELCIGQEGAAPNRGYNSHGFGGLAGRLAMSGAFPDNGWPEGGAPTGEPVQINLGGAVSMQHRAAIQNRSQVNNCSAWAQGGAAA